MNGAQGRKISVAFADASIKSSCDALKAGRFEDIRLANLIDGAISDLKKNPLCGIRIPSRIWPKIYVQKFAVSNLFKIDLNARWRLIYTIRGDQVEVISVILEWMDHKEYARRFGYRKK